MTRVVRQLPLGLLVAGALAAFGCDSDPRLASKCRTDLDCPAGFSCDSASGNCLCKSDSSCKAAEFCNPVGFCQKRVGCDSNADCPPDQFCDSTTGNCLDRTRCLDDLHCPIGQVCDRARFSCVLGCRAASDCELGQVCRCAGGGEDCPIGQCIAGPCDDQTFCEYGEICEAPEAGADKMCKADERGPFCQVCDFSPGSELCPATGDQANHCLIDDSRFGSYFCGVDCSHGEPCPNGFACQDIFITPTSCGSNADCPLLGHPCNDDTDCPGGHCDLLNHQCQGDCVGNEGGTVGGCTCVKDADCPTDTCDIANRRCTISARPCFPGGTECSAKFHCIYDEFKGRLYGFCLIGSNCGPAEGVTCDEVRAAQQQ